MRSLLTRRRALANAATGAAAVLPAPRALAFPVPGADAELLRLGRLLDAAWARERALTTAPDRDTAAWDAAWAASWEETSGLVDEIAALPAATLAGLRVKARAVSWCWSGERVEFGEGETTDIRIAASIVSDLLAEGPTPGG